MMDLAFFARASGGILAGNNCAISSVSTDSRHIAPGALFVAIKGDTYDGHDFVEQAFRAGAAAALVATERAQGLPIPRVVVADPLRALAQCAAIWREPFELPLFGITGSNGKTTVKEMLAAICRVAAGSSEAVLATEGNFNNHIGLPLTLLRLNEAQRFAIIEMGMNHPGEIAQLTRLAAPTVALINNAQRAHLAGLESLEAVARAKGEIFEGLGPQGVGVINDDDAFAGLWRDLLGKRRSLGFGLRQGAEVRGECQATACGSRVSLFTPVGRAQAELRVPGEHNVRNALAATACALAADIVLDDVVRGLERFSGVPGRLQDLAGPQGARLINDCYNANPDSVAAAMDVLAACPGKRILVLGDMGELGAAADALHEDALRRAQALGIERIYVLGEAMSRAFVKSGAAVVAHPSAEVLAAAVRGECDAYTTILVKGSRFMKMERVVALLAGRPMEEH